MLQPFMLVGGRNPFRLGGAEVGHMEDLMALYNTSNWRGDPGANLTAAPPAGAQLWGRGLKPKVMGWILSVASCLIISTNLLVAAALLQLIRRKGIQSWCFVLNLALADAMVGLAITGIATADFASNATAGAATAAGGSLASQKTKCLLRMAFVISPSTASILSMFLISLDRYVAIKLPLRYSQLTGRWTVAGSLGVLWVLSLIVGFLPGMVRDLQQGEYGGFCAFFSVIRPSGILVVFCVSFFPVLSVFLYFYLDILKIACGHQQQIRQARQAGSRLSQGGGTRYWGHVKALRTVALLVGCFTLSWCPFFVVCAVQVLCEGCELHKVLESHLWLLGLSNSLINPLVYACWQREVRAQIGAIFSRVKGSLRHTGSSDVSERCHTPRPVPTQTAGEQAVGERVSGIEPRVDPTLLPHLTHQEARSAPLSDSTL